jgi:hypothetical protein
MNKLTPPMEQEEPDPFLSMTDAEQTAWAQRIGQFARSKLTNADGSLKPETSDLQRNLLAPKLKVVK